MAGSHSAQEKASQDLTNHCLEADDQFTSSPVPSMTRSSGGYRTREGCSEKHAVASSLPKREADRRTPLPSEISGPKDAAMRMLMSPGQRNPRRDLAAARRGCGSGDIAGSAPKSPRGSHVLGISTWAKRAAHSEGALGAEQGVMGLGLWGQILRLLGSYRSGYTEGCLSLDLAGPTVQAFARD